MSDAAARPTGRIEDMVREAHLSHFCAGGLGVPVTSSGLVGMADDARLDAGAAGYGDDRQLTAAGQTCGRCGERLEPGQDARRLLTAVVVHAACAA